MESVAGGGEVMMMKKKVNGDEKPNKKKKTELKSAAGRVPKEWERVLGKNGQRSAQVHEPIRTQTFVLRRILDTSGKGRGATTVRSHAGWGPFHFFHFVPTKRFACSVFVASTPFVLLFHSG